MTREESNTRRICCPMCDKKKCDREADDCDVKRYLKNRKGGEDNGKKLMEIVPPKTLMSVRDIPFIGDVESRYKLRRKTHGFARGSSQCTDYVCCCNLMHCGVYAYGMRLHDNINIDRNDIL